MGDEEVDAAPATADQSEGTSATDAGTGTGESSSSSTAEPAARLSADERGTTAKLKETETPPPPTAASPSPGQRPSVSPNASRGKVKIHFVAVGSAPLMKKTKFAIGSEQRFSSVMAFLRKMLKLGGAGSSLFLYVNSAFVPSPDESVGDLNECFSVRGELMVHYSLQEAWG